MTNDSDAGNAGTASPDAQASGDNGNIRSPVTTAAMALTEWTVEAMLDAEPYPLPEVSEDAMRSHAQSMIDQLGGTGATDGGGTDSGGEPAGGGEVGEALGDTETQAGGYGYPAPFTRFEVPFPYTQYPLVTIGKVFFSQNGRNYVASAASIGNYAILTAGHVVHAGDGTTTGWSQNLVFVPGYKDGVRPVDTWAASWLATRTNWYNNGNPGGLWEDIGGAVLHPLRGRKISQVVGWLGFSWNWSREQHWCELGYPAAPPFNGQRLNAVAASYAYDGSVAGSVKPVASGNDMTGGCSGGPWVRGMFSGNWVNGVNSYRLTSRPLEMNSPYFDDRAKSLKDLVVGGTP